MKVAIAQIDPTVGDFTGNLSKIVTASRRAADSGARLTIFSELSICGYWPADLLDKPVFLKRCATALEELRQATASLSTAVLVGVALPAPAGACKPAVNAAVLLDKGKILLEQHKMLLPFYDVFDEQRYFCPARSQHVIDFEGERLAVTICEDAWNDKYFWPHRFYDVDPVEDLMRQKPTILINISASPFWHGKRQTRYRMLAAIAQRHKIPVFISNQVGGNDSLIFDGSSFGLAPDGTVIGAAASFAEDVVTIESQTVTGQAFEEEENGDEQETSEAYRALVLGTRDYVYKTGFRKAIVGLSGGIDSALVASIAVDALGPENVIGLGMPSQYSSGGSVDDSRKLAQNLGIRFEILPIAPLFQEFVRTLDPVFAGKQPDITEENLQSRIRGTLLMALSNKFGSLVLTTGNKSEMSVGYCTLYGDMVGALAVIGDLVKTRVYALSRWVNRDRGIIPEAILTKAPSAELRPDQKDTDSLPPYEVLDPILEAYVERYEGSAQIVAEYGFPVGTVEQVVHLVERTEYKRQQAAPVLKVTPKAFGMGRRFPIAARAQV
ncbi:NAD+ synthase [Acidicapsa dinghuensis]|uniref:Glutamine-dependent NAD(+) synthetase n=1 Tax=Acidicapsa dinghuensis TaxID=2218256 RepID=A0ABW1EN91_9BACT|nr:NAD+ synthase [Acidicapsa dinghuensis]